MAADGTITFKPLNLSPPAPEVDLRTASKISGRSLRYLEQLADEGRIPSRPQTHREGSVAMANLPSGRGGAQTQRQKIASPPPGE